MAVTTMDLLELLRKADGADVDFLREGVRVLAQALMDAEVSAQIGAEHSQRNPERTTHRNGYRARDWDTRVGTIDLQIPRVREGSYLPSFLEPRRRAERALAAVVAQDYVEGVSTRRVEDIAQAMGITSLSKSQVSRICGELDELVAAWRNRPLDAGPYGFVWLDALSVKVREQGRVGDRAALPTEPSRVVHGHEQGGSSCSSQTWRTSQPNLRWAGGGGRHAGRSPREPPISMTNLPHLKGTGVRSPAPTMPGPPIPRSTGEPRQGIPQPASQSGPMNWSSPWYFSS